VISNFGLWISNYEFSNPQSAIRNFKMRPSGWVFLSVSWGLILGLCLFCFQRVFERRRR